MPLSEQEQRLLDEMERQLMHTDADVVHASASRSFSYRNLLIGTLLVLVGLGGVIGFAAMVAGVIIAVAPGKGTASSAESDPTPQSPSSSNVSFMDKMNDRWDRRHHG